MMKFGFVTCVQLGLACMEEIYRAGGKLDLVITLHDKLARQKSGRIYIDEFCAQHGIDVVKIRHINDLEAITAIKEADIDWLFIIGWSQIAGQVVLNAPTRGCIGIHPTLLPQGRGRAAIPWAILKGLDKSGVTMFKLDAGVDTGSILAQEVIPLMPDETATTLYKRVAEAHQTIIAKVWPALVGDTLTLQVQDESQATEWPGRKPEDGIILPDMDCIAVDRLVRAVTYPYPGAFIEHQGNHYTIWSGCAHPDGKVDDNFYVDGQNHLWFRVIGGVFEAIEWDVKPVTIIN
jgi:methionyl-tRNA formyltransferase